MKTIPLAFILLVSSVAFANPSPLECLDGWRHLSCPAPVIYRSYIGDDCMGTSGWFIVGENFQHEGPSGPSTADYGPRSFGANGNQKHWNVITPRQLCVTVGAGPGDTTWTGHTIYVENPDGQQSNSVVVENLIGHTPTPPVSGTDDPFDPDACPGPKMTQGEALRHFPVAASRVVLAGYDLVAHTRQCNTLTGCADWGMPFSDTLPNRSGELELSVSGSRIAVSLAGKSCGYVGNRMYCYNLGGPQYYSGTLASDCFQVSGRTKTTPGTDGSYSETEYATFVRF